MNATDTAKAHQIFDSIFAKALARFGDRRVAAEVTRAIMLEAFDAIKAGA